MQSAYTEEDIQRKQPPENEPGEDRSVVVDCGARLAGISFNSIETR